MKKIVIGVIVAILALVGIMYVINKNKAKNEAQTAVVAQKNSNVIVRAGIAEEKELSTSYVANGIFAPKQEVKISSETPGRVARVLVQEGAFVNAGQTLAVIEADKQNVNVSNANAVYNNARSEVSRFESAYASGGVTKQQLDQVKLQLENAKNNLRNAQLTAGDVIVKSSFSGIVNKRSVEPGLYVNPGMELFEIVNITSLKLKIDVDEKNISSLKLGQEIEVTSTVLANQTFTGVVSFIAPKANASLSFPVELEIRKNTGNAIKAGMYGTANFGGDRKSLVFVVPRSAFVGNVSSGEVFIIKDGKAILTPVVAGRNFGDYVEIISGLEKGQQVITSGHINLVNESPIEIIK